MKKLLFVGDLHGSSIWKTKVEHPEQYDRIIFLGDFCDHWTRTDEQILTNLAEVILFKKQYPDKVVLLIGNHDAMYINRHYSCSGYRPSMKESLFQLFNEDKSLFQIAYEFHVGKQKYICSHAGILYQWHKWCLQSTNVKKNGEYDETIHSILKNKSYTLAEKINTLYRAKNWNRLYDVGYDRGGGSMYGGPLWVDLRTLIGEANSIRYKQIIGHSELKSQPGWFRNRILDIDVEYNPFFELEVDNYTEYQ